MEMDLTAGHFGESGRDETGAGGSSIVGRLGCLVPSRAEDGAQVAGAGAHSLAQVLACLYISMKETCIL
jgi:hypothetical protein